MKIYFLYVLFIFWSFVYVGRAQSLPKEIKSYLNRNYKGWEILTKECGDTSSKGFVFGNFSGAGKRDFAVKFVRGQKGYILAFLKMENNYKPFVLHNYSAEDAKYSNLGVWEKGEVFGFNGKSLRLKHDAPSDYRCESNVGGIHYYRNGKFVGY